MNIEQMVLDRVVPSDQEERRLREAVSAAMEVIDRDIRRKGLKAQPLLVGSVAKGTYLTNPEVDVFVAFPPETSRENLERYGLQLGAFLKNRKRMFAEHPYTRGEFRGFEVEVVPCYAVASPEQKMSAVDRTPYHTKYVLGKITPEQRDQVRLLKAFMKGIGAYGAEAKIQGFSGYLCELLVLKYGTFRETLEAATKWQAGNIIALDLMPTRIFDEPLIVVDPVDAGRNVASAVSKESMSVMIHAATEYLRKPCLEFFFPNPSPKPSRAELLGLLKSRGTHLVVIAIPAPKVTDDVLYPQVRKALKAFEELFARHDFSLMRSRFEVVGKEALFMFEFEKFSLPRAKKHIGPPAWVKNALDFQSKWRHSKQALCPPYIEDGQWVVDIEREHLTAAELVVSKFRELSLGKDFEGKVGKTLRTLVDEEALRPAYLGSIDALLDRRFPWER